MAQCHFIEIEKWKLFLERLSCVFLKSTLQIRLITDALRSRILKNIVFSQNISWSSKLENVPANFFTCDLRHHFLLLQKLLSGEFSCVSSAKDISIRLLMLVLAQ